MMDYKKTEKDLYQPKTTPSVVDVPEMAFVMIDGKGDPNTSAKYANAVQTLYGLSYAIKMRKTWTGYFDYVVPPLEGLWDADDEFFRGGGAAIADKDKFSWTMMIRLPEFVTPEVFGEAKTILSAKKPELDLSLARLEKFAEGLCAQVLHIGPYDDEPATVAALEKYAVGQGYRIDISDTRRHHEIYLSDPRKTVPGKLKTIIRHPIRRAEP